MCTQEAKSAILSFNFAIINPNYAYTMSLTKFHFILLIYETR